MRSPNFKVVEFDYFRIGGIRHIHEADFRRAATIAITFQPSALHRFVALSNGLDDMLLPHQFLSVGFGRGERGGDEGLA